MAANRKYDIVLFGATGFTGALTAHELAKRQPDEGFTWAIAGRNKEKLETLAAEIAAQHGVEADIITANSDRPLELEAMAAQAQAIITTVGPYKEYGEPLVRACAAAGTDYVDLTGEGEFVETIKAAHHDTALETGARIVNCCGYDSIPADLGARLTVEELSPDGAIEVYAFTSFGSKSGKLRNPFNSISGGTWASAIGFMNFSEPARARRAVARADKEAGPDRKIRATSQPLRRSPNPNKWGLSVPLIDVEIVLRSAAADDRYGPDFTYGHHTEIPSSALPLLPVGALGMGSLFMAAQFPPTRSFLLSLKQSGDGPDEETREDTKFKTTFLGIGGGKEVVAQMTGGDPGYGDTAKMLAETAICLVKDGRKIPQTAGVITPVMATGTALKKRLNKSGVKFEVVSEEG